MTEQDKIVLLPPEWEVETVEMTIEVDRILVPLSKTTAELLSVVLACKGVGVDAWVLDHAIADAEATTAFRRATPTGGAASKEGP